MRTNFWRVDGEDQVYDLYSSLLEDWKEEIQSSSLEASVKEAVSRHLNRKLVKKVYMPLVYGKTQHSAAADIQKGLDWIWKRAESKKVADIFYKGQEITSRLMNLVNQVGWWGIDLFNMKASLSVPYRTTWLVSP